MLVCLALACSGLLLPSPPGLVVSLRATAQQAAPTPTASGVASVFPATSLLIADGADEMAEKDAARLKGLGVLAFGVLPSLWAQGEIKEGAKKKKKKKKVPAARKRR